MNERIESYLKQHHCRDYFNACGDTVEDDHYFMYREEVDGLIELIVRECAGITDDNLIPDHPVTGAVYDGIQSKKILEHFGVEE